MGKELGDCMNYNRCDINKLENYFREMGYIRLDYVVNPKTKESFKCKEKYGITLLYHDKKAVVIVYCPMVYMYKTGQLSVVSDDISENLQGFDLANVLYVFVGDNRCHAIKGSNVISIDEHSAKIKARHLSESFDKEFEVLREDLNLLRKKDEFIELSVYGNSIKPGETYILIGLIALISFISIRFNSESLALDYLAARDTGVGAGYQTYRYITYMFTHASGWHLLGNMISLFYIGRAFLRRRSSIDMILTFLLGGVIAGVGACYINPALTGATATVGASGAIFAILGGTIAALIKDEEADLKKQMIKYAVLALVYSAVGRNVDNVCHLVGLAGGFATQWILDGFAAAERLRFMKKDKKAVENVSKKDRLLNELRAARNENACQ